MNKLIPVGQFRACQKLTADGGVIYYKQLYSCPSRQTMDIWLEQNKPFETDIIIFTSVELLTTNEQRQET